MPKDDEFVEIDGDCLYEVTEAWKVRVMQMGVKEPTEVRLPKSQCERLSLTQWRVPTWLAEKERLI